MTRSAFQLSADVNASRYEIERKLGQGATGAVFLAKDTETGEHVALKKLFHMDAKSVLRLKHEFRSLVDVAHPHIIKLYDMGRADDCWFLTMEYLEGVDLTTYLYPGEVSADDSLTSLTADAVARDHRRILSAFLQLSRGIQGLHAAGMLHRDLKPNNVLVVGDRVVVLDFGLVRDLGGGAATMTEDGSIAGTPAYMSPEQIKGTELGAPSDWYAFGVMLYEAISGELPIDGTLVDILRGKLEHEPPPLRELAPEVPRWLDELCQALLSRDPNARPSGEQVVAAFELACQRAEAEVPKSSTENSLGTDSLEHPRSRLVGREHELAMLRRASSESERGAAVAHVRGPSGTGKSVLVEQFLDEAEAEHDAEVLVLRSRCYELEQMPFKALDAVIDALVRHLLHLDDLAVAQVLPHEIAALVQLFPALERLNAVKRLAAVPTVIREAVNERQRAESALRQLLDRLAARKRIVLWIDDLQWGDLDSARILRSWLQVPTDASILFIFSYRSEEMTTSTCLAELLEANDPKSSRAVQHVIDVAPLSSTDIRSLCKQRFGSEPAAAEVVERIVREAHGSPFLASQLSVMAEAKIARGDTDLTDLSLDALIAQTSAMLPTEATALLAVLAVGGRPMPPKLALQAAGVRRKGRAVVHALRGLNLVRTREIAGHRMLEVYHDRVRERVQASLDDESSRSLHQRLLDAIEFSGHADPDWMHTLALGAHRDEAALEYGLVAAERATATLAFERAAELLERCIALTPRMEGPRLWAKYAEALVRCGRGMRAAEAYLKAAEHGTGAEASQYRQLAAANFLRSGQFERGEQLVREVLRELDIPIPQSEAGLLAAIVWEQTRIKLRGTKYVARQEHEAPAALLAKYDTLSMLTGVTQQYDPLRAALFQLRGFQLAFETGEPRRIVNALGSAAVATSLSGSMRAARKAQAMLDHAEVMARELSDRERGTVWAGRAISSFMLGRVSEVIEPSRAADRAFCNVPRDDPEGGYYTRYVVASVRVGALYHLGEFRESRTELEALLSEARATQNRSLLLQQTLNQTSAELVTDEAALCRPRLDDQARELPRNSFGILHVLHMVAVMQAACATGDFAWARALTDGAWKHFIRSPLRRSAYLTTAVNLSRAHLLLNEYSQSSRNDETLRAVREHLRVVRSTPALLSATASRFEARSMLIGGDRSRAAEMLRGVPEALENSNLPAEAAVDRVALAHLLGRADSVEAQRAEQTLGAMGVANPRSFIRSYYPELIGGGA